ncbi:MAG: hypothetical protein WAU70_09420, partial [Flavobacteriales bacterium]
LVSPLRAMLGIGPIVNNYNGVVNYERVWHNKALDWRIAHPIYRYHLRLTTCRDLIFTERKQMGASLLLAAMDPGSAPASMPEHNSFAPLRVWIGLDSRIRWRFRPYINIPMRLRPSPLNLIFKDLTGKGRTLEADKVRFQAIDFDTL